MNDWSSTLADCSFSSALPPQPGLRAVYSHAYAWARRWIVMESNTRGRDQSAPSDPIKTDANPPSHPYKSPTDSQLCQPPLPIPSSPSACPRQGLPDFAIRPRDKHRGCLVHKAAAWCFMLTLTDSVSSLVLVSSPREAGLFWRSRWAEGKMQMHAYISDGQISPPNRCQLVFRAQNVKKGCLNLHFKLAVR